MRSRWIVLAIAAVSLTAKTAAAHSDEALGYSFTVPTGWRPIAIAAEEKYIVARWQSEREFVDKKEGFSHRPEIKVVLFDPKGKFSKEKREVEGLGDDVTWVTINNPYKNYKDWVKSDGEGGRYISKEDEITVNGVPTTWYEVAYEKLTVPRHGLAFVYHAADIDYCVTTEVLEQEWKKLSPNLLSALRTFKIFPRKNPLKPATTPEVSGDPKKDGSLDSTPEGRYKRRKEAFDRKLKLCQERLTAGWKVKWSDQKNYVALTHTDDKFTSLILDQAEGVRAWADENLGFFGTGIPSPKIVRIFKDFDEQRAFEDLSSRSNGGGLTWLSEISLSRTEAAWGLGNVAGDVYRMWLQDKNSELSWSLPNWLDRGIREWVSHAYFKGGKLEFRPDVDTTVALKTAAKQGTLIKVRDLVMMTDKDISKADNPGAPDDGVRRINFSGGAYQQSSGFVRYLMTGPGRSNSLTKDLLKTYVENLIAFAAERDKSPAGAGESYKAPETEEEEEARFKDRKSYWDDGREKELLKAVFDRTFGTWKESDWSSIEKSYRAFAN